MPHTELCASDRLWLPPDEGLSLWGAMVRSTDGLDQLPKAEAKDQEQHELHGDLFQIVENRRESRPDCL